MENVTPAQTYGVYPGEYVPYMNKEKFLEELKQPKETSALLPEFSVTEMQDLIKVTLAIPGVSREDFLIQADSNLLSVYLVHKRRQKETSPAQELNYQCFERHLPLTVNVDVEFTIAEYRDGVLCMYFPKVKEAVRNKQTRIVVY